MSDDILNLEKIKSEIQATARSIRAEMRPGEAISYSDSAGLPPVVPIRLPRLALHTFPRPNRGAFHYRDLAVFDDREFIQIAYRVLLRHGPDPAGERSYLELLHSGHHKAEIILRLRYSHEGRTQAVRIRGLFLPLCFATLAFIPGLRRVINWFASILFLPRQLQKLRMRQSALLDHINATNELAERKINEQIHQINRMNRNRQDA